jgi:chromate transporter
MPLGVYQAAQIVTHHAAPLASIMETFVASRGYGLPSHSQPHSASLIELFLLFSKLGLSSFGGGVSAWMHRAFVERRVWLDEREFSAALALGRIMPGANVINLAVLIGQRLRGAPGAVAAAMGLIVGPSLAVIALAILYRQFVGTNILHVVLEGTAASAVGLIISMGVMSSSRIIRQKVKSGRRTAQRAGAIVVLVATFVFIGVLRFPTVPTVLCLAPFSIALAFFAASNLSTENHDDGG